MAELFGVSFEQVCDRHFCLFLLKLCVTFFGGWAYKNPRPPVIQRTGNNHPWYHLSLTSSHERRPRRVLYEKRFTNVVYPVRDYGRTRRSLLGKIIRDKRDSLLVRCSWNVFQFARPPPRTTRRLSVRQPADLLLSSHRICRYCIMRYSCAEFELCQALLSIYWNKTGYKKIKLTKNRQQVSMKYNECYET